jgi:hypothetical protein
MVEERPSAFWMLDVRAEIALTEDLGFAANQQGTAQEMDRA